MNESISRHIKIGFPFQSSQRREAVILFLALKQADTAHTESKCIPTVRSEQEKGTKTAHIRINYFLTGFFPL